MPRLSLSSCDAGRLIRVPWHFIFPFLLAGLLFSGVFYARGQQQGAAVSVTLSAEWQSYIAGLGDPSLIPVFPAPDDSAGWAELKAGAEVRGRARSQKVVDQYKPLIKADTLNGVPVLDIRPANLEMKNRVVVYLHGGAYTLLSAASTLNISVQFAAVTGLRVLAVDYTCAPEGKWNTVVEEVIKVVNALLSAGYSMNDIAIFGDSAGGGLAAGVTLRMRDLGIGVPAALVLWSPWADLTESGDTYITLRHADPVLSYEKILKPSADAYALPGEQKNPLVSPVYGDFSKGFPPTLIQGGTREILLSGFIRLYQAIDIHGNVVKQDLYECMIHNFQAHLPASEEAQIALGKCRDFLRLHLNY